MQKTRRLIGTGALGFILMACAGNHPLLIQRSQSEAESLQAYCKGASLADADTHSADSLLALSNRHSKDGDLGPAQAEAENAGSLYRLALARRDLAKANSEVEGVKAALGRDKDQLQTYQQILEEMKTVRKP